MAVSLVKASSGVERDARNQRRCQELGNACRLPPSCRSRSLSPLSRSAEQRQFHCSTSYILHSSYHLDLCVKLARIMTFSSFFFESHIYVCVCKSNSRRFERAASSRSPSTKLTSKLQCVLQVLLVFILLRKHLYSHIFTSLV